MNILIREKANVARLRDLLEKETDPLIKESISFRLAEARLWHDVAEYKLLNPEQIEQVEPKTYKRVKIVAIGITIAIILAMLFLTGCNSAREGCHLIGAACQDAGWIATKIGDNVRTGN